MYRLKSPLTIDKIWPLVMHSRREQSIEINLKNQLGNNFWFVINETIKMNLEIIDKEAK